jgi:cytochrome bd ubiquinol oxidase subunit I
VLVPMALSGWVATLAGWYTAEIGRQPWLVSGVLKAADALGPVPAGTVAASLAAYLIVYAVLLLAYVGVILRLTVKAAREGDRQPEPGVEDQPLGQPVRGSG